MARETPIHDSILERIGGTPLVRLRHLAPRDSARVLVKMESENPTGSMKDRMALAMIEAAEQDGRLGPGGNVVEYTGGSTGISLALVCGVKGYPLHIVTSDAFSLEKRDHMRALGAELTLVQSVDGGIDETLIRNMIATAHRLREGTDGFWTDQLNNVDQLDAYRTMGEEIWDQTGGQVDAFVQSVGTAGSVRGAAEALHRRNPEIHVVAVEPSESAVLSGGETGVHRIEGIGAGFVVPLWQAGAVDEVRSVSTDEAKAMTRRLAREEGLFAGTSTGGNVAVALEVARRLGPEATVVTPMCDSGLKYLSTDLYR
ncbi:MAG: cysteine synthase family protein [Alphaproteobacteria bacterium]|jgi:cysteine synthase A|nr:cysteine synthase family protein [Alphaproteobacteria bacterium]